MKICVSKQSMNYLWTKGGEDIAYKPSLHGRPRDLNLKVGEQYMGKQYFSLSFTYEFTEAEDKTFFAYCFPYDFSTLTDFISSQRLALRSQNADFFKETILCQSLGGVDVPLLTITSRIYSDAENYQNILQSEFQDPRLSIPLGKKKRHIILCARVHPGESNSSFMMQGFIKYLIGNTQQAKELRKRCIFKIIPMVNPDGVIIGNYRTNMAGNDLNRKYHAPDEKLHPTVCAIKKLVQNITYPDGNMGEIPSEDDRVFAFIDMHGHSRKKNVFVYGPYYPLHNDKHLKMRVLPKLISEQTPKFRYFSCKFRIERSKEKAARIVLWREFQIMNCFTFEASFFGGLDNFRHIEEFTPQSLEKMGEHLANAMYEYLLIQEQEDKQKKVKEGNKKKKKKKTTVASEAISSVVVEDASIENSAKKRKKSVSKPVSKRFEQNPNEPPCPTSDVNAGDESPSKPTGIRTMKDMFRILKNDQKQKEDEPSSGEEEGKAEDSGSDSDPLEGELSGAQQAALYSNIKGTIDKFENYFNNGGLKKRNLNTTLKIIKKATKDQQRNLKSPLSNPMNELKVTGNATQQLKKKESLIQPAPVAVIQKPKKSFKQIAEESRAQYLARIQPKTGQAIVPQTNIEFLSSKESFQPPPVNHIPAQYQTIKNTGFQGISTHAYSVPAVREQRAPSRGPFDYRSMSNKIDDQSDMIPHKQTVINTQLRESGLKTSQSRYIDEQQRRLSTPFHSTIPINLDNQLSYNAFPATEQKRPTHPYQGSSRMGQQNKYEQPKGSAQKKFAARLEMSAKRLEEQRSASRQSNGGMRSKQNASPFFGQQTSQNQLIGYAIKEQVHPQNTNNNGSRQVSHPQPQLYGGSGGSFNNYNFTNTTTTAAPAQKATQNQILDYELNKKDIQLQGEQRRLRSQRPMQQPYGYNKNQPVKYHQAMDLATVALLSEHMNLKGEHSVSQAVAVPNTEVLQSISFPKQHSGTQQSPIKQTQDKEKRTINSNQIKTALKQDANNRSKGFNLQTIGNFQKTPDYMFDPNHFLSTLQEGDPVKNMLKADQLSSRFARKGDLLNNTDEHSSQSLTEIEVLNSSREKLATLQGAPSPQKRVIKEVQSTDVYRATSLQEPVMMSQYIKTVEESLQEMRAQHEYRISKHVTEGLGPLIQRKGTSIMINNRMPHPLPQKQSPSSKKEYQNIIETLLQEQIPVQIATKKTT